MAPHANLANAVLAVTAGVLLYIAIEDLRRFRIRNILVLLLVALFFAHTALAHRWSVLPWNLAIAGLIFLVQLLFYARSWMGGGDIKILTVAFLWVGADCALPFAIFLCVFASIHSLAAKLNWVPSQPDTERSRHQRIAFAPSVAAAIICVFLLGCLQRSA
jgi:prepilin peptidase CpaA